MKDLRAIIGQHPVFNGLSEKHLTSLAEHAMEAFFDIDQIIFREGEVAWQFYLILHGKVALEAYVPNQSNYVQIQCVQGGEVLGWSWLFQPYHWHFQARAVEPTEAVFLDGSRLLIACERDHELGYQLMKRITQVLIHRLESTRNRLLEYQDSAAAA